MLRRGQDAFGGSVFHEFAAVQDRDAVGAGRGVQVVGDQYQGQAAAVTDE